jgi:hypothetical protein
MRIAEFAQAANLPAWVADPAFGIVLARGTEHAAEAAKRVGGRAWFGTSDSFAPDELAILNRLKKSFDPDHRLATLTPQTS